MTYNMRPKSALSLECALLTWAVALFPLYVFPSGGLQPSHIAFLFLSLTVLPSGVPRQTWLLLFGFFAFYSFLVEAITSIVSGEVRHLVNPAFFLFNFLLMAGVYKVVRRNGSGALKYGVFIALTIALISVYLGGVDLREIGDGGRPTGTFNNPNQLGYFSVCVLSIAYLLYVDGEIRLSSFLALLVASMFLAVASLSKAAIIAGFAALGFLFLPSRGRGGVLLWIAIVLASIAAAVWLTSSGHLDELLFFNRLANMADEGDSSLVDRGYFAFLEGSTAEIIFGLGSSEVYRIVGHEVHSTFASVWNTYGIVGFIIFLPIFVIWARTLYHAYGLIGMIVLAGPAILYGVGHNGTRFSIFWLLMAVSMATGRRALTRPTQTVGSLNQS
jgi:hypothetical protein